MKTLYRYKHVRQSKNMVLLLCLIIFISIVITACGNVFHISFDSENQVGNSMNNIQNMGYVSKQDDYIFFYQSGSQEGLYCSKADGSNKMKLDSGFVHDINIKGDKLYYVVESFVSKTSSKLKDLYSYSLYCMDLNEMEKKEILKDCSNIFVTDTYIYYTFSVDTIAYSYNDEPIPENQGYLYRYSKDTMESELLIQKYVDFYQIYNSNIYFILQDGNLYYIEENKASQSSEKLLYKSSDENYMKSFYFKNKNTLIGYDYYNIFTFDISSNESTVLYNDKTDIITPNNFAVFDDCLYFFSPQNYVCKLSYSTGEYDELFAVNHSLEEDAVLYKIDNECYYWNGKDIPKIVS